MPRFELVEGTISKFWSVERTGATVVTSWGRIGTDGQSKTKDLGSDAAAVKEEQQLVAEKTKKGYSLVDAPKPAAKKSAEAKPVAKASAKAPTADGPKPSAPSFDGSTNRYVNGAGERADVRVAPGDFPSPLPLSDAFGNMGPISWSPAGNRIAVVGAGHFRVATEGAKGWVEKTIEMKEDFSATDVAWSKDGALLFVAFDGTGDLYTKKALVVTFDAGGDEISRFEVPPSPSMVSVHPNGEDLLVTSTYGEMNGTHVYERKGKWKSTLFKDGAAELDPSGELMVQNHAGKYVTDLSGKELFKFEDTGVPHVWINARELGVYMYGPPAGLYRVKFGPNSASEPELIGASEKPRSGFGVSPDGRLIGVLYKNPATLDLHDAVSGERLRRLKFPKGDSETCFTFAPDGRIAGAVNWQKVIHVYGTESKFGVSIATAPSEADKRKVSQKFFDTADLARKEGEKQILALTGKGFALDSIDPPQGDEDLERLELLRRIHAGPVAATARTALIPILGPRGKAARATRFRSSPILAPGESVPACPSCKKPMTCLAEIDLAALPATAGLTGEGVVQVFYCTNTDSNCEVETEAWMPGKGRSKLVRLVSGQGSAKAAPEGLEVVGFRNALDAPSKDDLESASGMKAAKALKAAKIDEDEWPGAVPGDKIGGYPAWVQDTEFPRCPACDGAMTELVLQMVSDGAAKVQFGDMGTAYVLRCPSHPSELDLIWQAG